LIGTENKRELKMVGGHAKNVFSPDIFVGFSFQVLEIRWYACGLKPDSAMILNQNPIFEMASNIMFHFYDN